MKIPFRIERLEDAPEPLRPFFAASNEGTAFHLEVEAHPDSLRVDEFRQHNRQLHSKLREAEEQLRRFDGLDADVAREALARMAQASTTEDTAAKRVQELEAALDQERNAHRATRLSSQVASRFLALGGEPRAVDFVTARASTDFTIDGQGTVKARSGHLELDAWLKREELSFCFKPSRGGGSFKPPSASPTASDNRPVVDRNDALAIGRHAEAIARGLARVSE